MADEVDSVTVENAAKIATNGHTATSPVKDVIGEAGDHGSHGDDVKKEPVEDKLCRVTDGSTTPAVVEAATSRLEILAVESTAVDARPVNIETDARPFQSYPGISRLPPTHVPTDKESLYYNLDGPKLAIVFNHKNFDARFGLKARRGTEEDVKAIKKTFASLGWRVEVIDDAKLNDVKKVISDIQNPGTLLTVEVYLVADVLCRYWYCFIVARCMAFQDGHRVVPKNWPTKILKNIFRLLWPI